MKYLAVLLAPLALTACATVSSPVAPPSFRAAVERHLDAVQGRDIDTFIDTITTTDGLRVIYPDGSVIEDTAEVIAAHRDWFADSEWRWEDEIVDVEEGADLSSALVRYTYRDTSDGAPRKAWLVLVFALEGGEWRLVHDQNTRIPADG